MKKVLLSLLVVAFALTGCHNLAGDISPTETYINSYEIAGAVAPLAKVYLARLEETGVLTGDKLVKFKANYATARNMMLQAGDVLGKYIDSPTGSLIANYPVLMQQFVIILADLTGGMVVKTPDGKSKIALDPKLKAIDAKMGPDEILLGLNMLIVIIDKIMSMYTTTETLTAEQKAAYHSRVDFVKKAIPEWI